ncbi:I78 family peptidase inhibitor [uncultured Paracoccus sp.]|uniref:I78 family peptidase inhibitor n=1 Tax=uncultured Paracoccus sp. TaxID=189685 RepID=UPI0025E0FB23|nr:I78 family peptidase inhibitor [uncultured Paracoccus sp.]
MKLSRSLIALAAPLALIACTEDGASQGDEVIVATDDPCGAARYTHLVGEQSPTLSIPEGQAHRIHRSGEPMTMEMMQDRLTFEVDNTGKLLSVTCS